MFKKAVLCLLFALAPMQIFAQVSNTYPMLRILEIKSFPTTPESATAIRFYEPDSAAGSEYIGIVAPSSLSSSYTVILPAVNQAGVLENDGSGNLVWNPASAASTTFATLTDTDISGVAGGQIPIWDGANSWDNVSLSGDATLAANGVLTISSDAVGSSEIVDGAIVSADISNSANITVTQVSFDPIEEVELDSESELEAQIVDMGNILQASEINTSSELAALIDDETGSLGGGQIVFSVDPQLTGVTGTATIDFSGASEIKLIANAAPTVNAAGEIGLDLSIPDHLPMWKYHDGTQEHTVIGIRTADLPTTDDYRLAYDAVQNKFEFRAPGAGGGGGSITVEEADGTPTVGSVSTIQFDQADGFTVTDESGGQVQIGLVNVPLSALISTVMAEGENISLLTNDANYQADSDTSAWDATKTYVNAQGFLTSETGDIESVTAGDGLGGGGTSGAVTLDMLLDTTGGLETVDDSLNIKLNGSSLALTAAGLAVNDVSGVTGADEDNVTLADVQAATSSDFHNIGGTDDDVPEAGDFGNATDLDANGAINAGAVDETKLADFTAYTILMRNAGTPGDPADLKVSTLTEQTTPGAGDWLLGEASTGEIRKFDVGDLPTGGGGEVNDDISVNGVAATDADFDDATPAAPANAINVNWQLTGVSPSDISANILLTEINQVGATGYASSDGDTMKWNLNTGLYPFEIEIQNSQIFAIDSSGNVLTAGTVDGKDIATNAAMLNEAETISANWDNTANPWANNEIADLPASKTTSGTFLHERGGLEADVSAYNGLIRISGGATSNVTDLSGLNTALGSSVADGAHTTSLSSDSVSYSVLGTPTYSSAQHMQNIVHSTGWVDGGAVTDGGSGTVNVAAGSGLIKATDGALATLYWTDWSQSLGLALTDNQTNYIYVDYNAGTPTVAASTSDPTGDRTKIYLARVYRAGTALNIFQGVRWTVGDHASLMMRSMSETMPFAHVSGAAVTEVGTRQLSVTAGVFWHGLTRLITAAVNTSTGGTFSYYYQDGIGGWTEVTSQTTIDNTQYDDGDGTLGTLSNNKYGVHWVYLAENNLYVQYGQGDYTLPEAQDASIPTVATPIGVNARLIAKIIVLKSASTLTSIESSFDTAFQGAPISGADVSGPASSTDNAIVRFDGATGKIVQNSGITIADGASGTLSGTNTGDQTITLTGDVTGSGTGSFAASIAASAVQDAEIDYTAVTLADFTNDAGFLTAETDPSLTNDAAVTIGDNTSGDITLTFDGDAGTDGKIKYDVSADAFVIDAPASIPADGDLANGQFAIWIDATGNELETKFKDSAGDVTQGAFTLLGNSSTGSGAVARADTPVLTTPNIADFSNAGHDHLDAAGGAQLSGAFLSGAITFPDGVTQVFNPDATNAGLNVGSHTADPSSPANGVIFYNSTTNKFRAYENGGWTDVIGGGSSEWTDTGTTLHPTETGDEVVLGASSPVGSAKLSIDGDADQIQFLVQGNATQTSALMILENSAGTDQFTVSNAGDGVFTGTVDAAGGDLSGGTVTLGTVSGAIDAGGATSLELPNGAGGTTVDAQGEVTVDATSGTLNYHDGTAERAISPIKQVTFTVENPGASEDIFGAYVDDASTITKIVAVLVGSATPSVTWTVRHSTDRSAAGNEVVTSGTTTTSTTTGSVVTSFNDATVPADSFLWLETTAQSGTVDMIAITVFYRQDP